MKARDKGVIYGGGMLDSIEEIQAAINESMLLQLWATDTTARHAATERAALHAIVTRDAFSAAYAEAGEGSDLFLLDDSLRSV